jgi:hypothetical protein
MNKFLQSLSILLILSCAVFAQERTWETFSPNDETWSILAPGVMNPDQEALASPNMMGSYSYNDAIGFFAVIYRDTPKGRILWKPFKKAHFKKVRKDFIKANKGELVKDEKFSNGNFTGREVYIRVPDGRSIGRESQIITKYRVQRLRMFFDDRRFYLVLAVLPEKEIDAAAINNYFNSFVVNVVK